MGGAKSDEGREEGHCSVLGPMLSPLTPVIRVKACSLGRNPTSLVVVQQASVSACQLPLSLASSQ